MTTTALEAIRQALRRAYSLGQTYWQQADGESYAENKRSVETSSKFEALMTESTAAITALLAELDALRADAAALRRIIDTYDAYRRRGVAPAPVEYGDLVDAIDRARTTKD